MKRQYILIHSITAHINLQSSIKLHDSLKQTPNQIPPLLLAPELHLATAHVVSGAGAAAPNSRKCSRLKRAILQPRPPQSFALHNVQEVIKPQVSTQTSVVGSSGVGRYGKGIGTSAGKGRAGN
ncbi:uncharacterized protein LOC115986770 [Quercus lobata]|uniref:uncharacterized protein LOC115986770 n=1 Tax=Quercus lobata TaxID=97700 RepID=UPI00124816D9|nr:uncharacterized protein LOC115986770 [Quercus lobata]